MTYLLFTLGLAALFFGGEFLVRGASRLALAFNISPMVIGLTIVGFGTSTPELLVSLGAALDGVPAIAIGNVLGSNIANILLILGVAAVIAPIRMSVRDSWRDLGIMLGATALVWVMLLGGVVTRLEGGVLLLGLLAFLWLSFKLGKVDAEVDALPPAPIWKSALMTLGGLGVLMLGADLLVTNATIIARTYGISEAVIGLTIVAVGTSLPELATSVLAALRKQMDIAVGNIIGSNIFNLLGILGITALVTPIPAEARFAAADMPWVAATSVGLVVLAAVFGGLPRLAGAALLAGYAGYVALMMV
ncbi:calcium/sodium antiporter [Paracoccaceae bacterium Fryx2]|nr:calcium/sodium antiporter [Paracoccaceae bacterium Fryx2]